MATDPILPTWAVEIYRKAKNSSVCRHIEFTLTRDELALIIDKSRHRCAVTGLPFRLGKKSSTAKRYAKRPFYPSLDRIDSSQGYSFENCRLVCVAANYAMHQWGEEVFLKMALGIVNQRYPKIQKVPGLLRKESQAIIDKAILPKGVTATWSPIMGKYRYRATIRRNGKNVHLGTFDTSSEAVRAYSLAQEEKLRTMKFPAA